MTAMPDAPFAHPLPVLQRGDGACEVRFERDEGGLCRARHVYQKAPCRVLFPTVEPGELPTAVVVTTSGGLTGGDRLRLDFTAAPGAAALITAQAAEKIYRSTGDDARIALTLKVETGAWLEWLPQETILFDGARLRRDTVAEVAAGGRLLAGEFLVLGRTARGERLTRGLLQDRWRVSLGGRLAWIESLRLDEATFDALGHPAGLGGAVALFTLVYAGCDAASRLDQTRALIGTAPDGIRAGATVLGDVMVVRLLGQQAYALRREVARLWAGFRQLAAGLPAALPRLWSL
ncbi:MAG: urease accessory protein UreD [Azospirillum sp.]|nr:urease accessory protein UreD [Azospirillum sp.]